MGRSGTVLTFKKTVVAGVNFGEVKVDVGGGQTITAMCFFPPGSADWPLPGDTAALVPGPRSGEWVAVGFVDPLLELPVSAAGERVLYSRIGPGVIGGKIVIKTNGDIVLNDTVTITKLGAITANMEVTAMAAVPAVAVSLSTHLHPTAVGPTSPPTPGT